MNSDLQEVLDATEDHDGGAFGNPDIELHEIRQRYSDLSNDYQQLANLLSVHDRRWVEREAEIARLFQQLHDLRAELAEVCRERDALRGAPAARERVVEVPVPPVWSAPSRSEPPTALSVETEAALFAGDAGAADSQSADPTDAAAELCGDHFAVLLVDGNSFVRKSFADAIGRYPNVTLVREGTDADDPSARHIVALNLLCEDSDPFSVVRDCRGAGEQAFAYCLQGGRGFLIGTIGVFAAPVDATALAARLKPRRGQSCRAMVVSADEQLMAGLRTELIGSGCSVSIAVDARQALSVLPMVKPNVLLVDLGQARADGLRLIKEVRSHHETARLPIGILEGPGFDAAKFRDEARMVGRSPTGEPELVRALCSRVLDPQRLINGDREWQPVEFDTVRNPKGTDEREFRDGARQ